MDKFPHAPLVPSETYPKITPEQAKQVLEEVHKHHDKFPQGAAIIIAVFTPMSVKYLIDGEQVESTLERFRGAEQ